MPVTSSYAPIQVPDVDIWDFLFERKNKPFPDDKGMLPCSVYVTRRKKEGTNNQKSYTKMPTHNAPTPTLRSKKAPLPLAKA